MRRVSRHWWATAPVAVALVGAAVVAAQPYMSFRRAGGIFINPVTRPVAVTGAESKALGESGPHAGGSGGGGAAGAPAVASAPEVTGATGARRAGAASSSLPTARTATARLDAMPLVGAVSSTDNAASSFGRFASRALPLGAASAFALYAGASEALGSTSGAAAPSADVSAAVAPTDVALGGAATRLVPTHDVAAVRAVSVSAEGVPGPSDGAVTDGAWLAATPWQMEAAPGDQVVDRIGDQLATPEATFEGVAGVRRDLADAFDSVLSGDVAGGRAAFPAAAAAAPGPVSADLVILANPEPTTIVLVAGGLLLLVAAGRRKRAA